MEISNQTEIENYQRRLQILRDQKAFYGSETPAPIIMEIQDTEKALRDLGVDPNEGFTVSTTKPQENKTPSQNPVSLSKKKERALIKALLACASISNRTRRDAIVNDLPTDIKSNISRDAADIIDVKNIVDTCLNYSDGLEELIEAIRFVEGDSLAMQGVDAVLE